MSSHRSSLDSITAASAQRMILPDGTYATQSAFVFEKINRPKDQKPSLRTLLLAGEFLVGSVLAVALTKLVLRYRKVCDDEMRVNQITAEV